LELEGIPGVSPPIDLKSDTAAENAVVEPSIGTLIITYDDPRTMDPPIPDWHTTELYVHTSDPGDPPSAIYLKDIGRKTRFEVSGLTPGETYYARLVIVDEAGNKATTAAVVSTVTQKVGPYHENEDRLHNVMVLNGEFGAQTLDVASNPPDFWYMQTGTYGASSDVYVSTTQQQTGGRSLHFRNVATASRALWSEFFPVNEGELLTQECIVRLSANSNGGSFNAYLYVYEEDKSTQVDIMATCFYSFVGTPIGSWVRLFSREKVASGARYGRIRFVYTRGSTGNDFYVDRTLVARERDSFEGYRSSVQAISTGAWDTIDFNSENHDYSSSFNTSIGKYVVPQDGAWQFQASCRLETLGTGKSMQLKFQKDTGSGFADWIIGAVTPKSNLSEDWSEVSTGMVEVNEGDEIRVLVIHDHGSDRNIPAGDAFFRGSQITW
jgi:hypothetical protein